MDSPLFETFPALSALAGIRHAFTLRIPGVDVNAERGVVLARLKTCHDQIRNAAACGGPLQTVTQIHGDSILTAPLPDFPVEADGIVTKLPGLCLGVYVADCGPVYAVDPVAGVIGLFHSGRKGTELGITSTGIRRMVELGSDPARMTVLLGPCIRPPHYEVDIAAAILDQARCEGVAHVVDTGICTASHPERYYSYRREKGSTGRMLALLQILPRDRT